MTDASDTFRLGTDPADRSFHPLRGRPLDERVAIEMTVEQWGLIAITLNDARDAADDFDSKESDEIAAVEAIIDLALSQT